jgi:ABC-type hemin transport system substrate-binding protein
MKREMKQIKKHPKNQEDRMKEVREGILSYLFSLLAIPTQLKMVGRMYNAAKEDEKLKNLRAQRLQRLQSLKHDSDSNNRHFRKLK